MSDFQNGFWGVSKRNLPWKDIIRKIILEIGDRSDLSEAEYNKIVGAKVFQKLPSARRMFESAIGTQDIDFSLDLLEAWFLLEEVPAFDTVPRAIRSAKSELEHEGKLSRKNDNGRLPDFNALITDAHERTCNVYPGIEPRFLSTIRDRIADYTWEPNKEIRITKGLFKGQIRVPDILCEKLQLAIEIDSLEFHSDRTKFTTDRQKYRALQQMGYYVFPFSGPELNMKNGVLRAIREIELFIESVTK